MQCDDIMTRKPYFLSTGQSAEDAAAQMRVLNVSVLPVCDAEQKVVGALTDRDIVLRLVADGLAARTPVEQLMSHEIFSCKVSDDAKTARALMQQHEVERLVCLSSDGKLVGMVGRADV